MTAPALPSQRLAPAELRILVRAAEGLANKEIATVEGISEQTVKNQLTTIYRKLGAEHRTGAVVIAARRGLIDICGEAPLLRLQAKRDELGALRDLVQRALSEVEIALSDVELAIARRLT